MAGWGLGRFVAGWMRGCPGGWIGGWMGEGIDGWLGAR